MENVHEDHGLIFCPASKTDSDGVFRVLVSAFRLKEGTDSWKHKRSLAYGATEQFLVLKKSGEIVASLIVHSHWLQVGSVNILKGDVGEVSVMQEMQGQGLGTQLMQESIKYLRDKGFHISRLGGLNRFYARFGYVPFPRRFYEFLLSEARAGASTISPEEIFKLTPEQEKHIRLYHPYRDWKRRNELYEHFNKNRSGTLVKMHGSSQPSPGDPDPRSLNFVYEENGEVFGYLFAYELPEEITPFEAKVIISDVAFQKDKPEAFKLLMRFVLREAAKRGVQRATGRIPYDPLLQKLLIDASVPFSLQELQSAPASNMMMVVNLKELLKTIAPELNRRCSILPDFSTFSLCLTVNDQTVSLLLKPSSIEVLGDNPGEKYLHCDNGAFLRWLFGINSFEEWQVGVSHNLNNEEFRVMSTLFRREPCASGPWG